MKSQSITKANALIEASYKLTLDEQRLVLACIAQVDSQQPLPADHRFTITADDFAKLFGIDREHAYEQMKEAIGRLWQREIILQKDQQVYRGIRWLDERSYVEGEGYVIVGFTQRVAPYLSELQSKFTTYRLSQVAGFKSTHAIRLYELLMQFKTQGKRLITPEQFKDCLGLSNEYPKFSDFKRWVIDPAVAEINAQTRLTVFWEARRHGKKVVMLEFLFSSDSPKSGADMHIANLRQALK